MWTRTVVYSVFRPERCLRRGLADTKLPKPTRLPAPVFTSLRKKGRDPYILDRSDVRVIQKPADARAVKEDALLFERTHSMASRMTGVIMSAHFGLILGASFMYVTSDWLLDALSFWQRLGLCSAIVLVTGLQNVVAKRNLDRSVRRLRVVRGGLLEVTSLNLIPGFSGRVRLYPLEKCSIFVHRLYQVSNNFKKRSADSIASAVCPLYIDRAHLGSYRYMIDVRYATFLDTDKFTRYLGYREKPAEVGALADKPFSTKDY